jgi:2-polyprenyl-3-methyl-5-hydroxy-6-metoxy-1,4-benzoquinol methylase
MQEMPPPFRYQSKENDPYSSHSVILSRVGEGAGKRILDVGSAQGELAVRFRERGFRVTCIEGDPVLAEAGKNKCDEMILADLDQPVSKLVGQFDIIVYGDVLEHLKNPLAVFRDLNQYLAPGGTIIVSVPNVAHLYVRLKLLVGHFDYMDRGIMDRTHLRFFTLASLLTLLQESGLRPVEVVGTPAPLYLVWPDSRESAWLRISHGINAALARNWRTMFGFQLVAVCRQGVGA